MDLCKVRAYVKYGALSPRALRTLRDCAPALCLSVCLSVSVCGCVLTLALLPLCATADRECVPVPRARVLYTEDGTVLYTATLHYKVSCFVSKTCTIII